MNSTEELIAFVYNKMMKMLITVHSENMMIMRMLQWNASEIDEKMIEETIGMFDHEVNCMLDIVKEGDDKGEIINFFEHVKK